MAILDNFDGCCETVLWHNRFPSIDSIVNVIFCEGDTTHKSHVDKVIALSSTTFVFVIPQRSHANNQSRLRIFPMINVVSISRKVIGNDNVLNCWIEPHKINSITTVKAQQQHIRPQWNFEDQPPQLNIAVIAPSVDTFMFEQFLKFLTT